MVPDVSAETQTKVTKGQKMDRAEAIQIGFLYFRLCVGRIVITSPKLLFSRRQVNVKSLMKTLTFHMITVIKPSQGRYDRNNQIPRKNAIVAKQCLWQGLKHAARRSHVARESILCGPRCFMGILK